jgi:ABC-type Fe3+/spermidine/putrescine transport system ATPase subunit
MALAVRGLAYAWPGWEPTLRGVDLDVPAGRSVFLLGPSGSGKSTLLRCIAGLERGYTGQVLLDGRDVASEPPHRRRIGMMFQEPALFPHLDAWRNVAFGLPYRGLPRAQHRAEAVRHLAMVGLADRAESHVDELSGGQRQRVALARTLAAQPRAVLLDEPLSALDRDLRERLGGEVKALLAQQGVPALWVTHDRDEARRLGDAVCELRDGKAVAA